MRGIISESIYDVLLNEAKTPEEILKVTKYKYKDVVPEDFIDNVFAIDPTKKKSFTRWACEMYKKGDKDIVHDLNNGTLSKIFEFFSKNSNKFSLSDIQTVQDAKDYAFRVTLNELLEKKGDGPENDFEYKDVDNKWGVAKYNTYKASKKLGQDCVWCTANWYGNGEYYYKEYTDNGDIFILFDKTKSERCNKRMYDFKRYQIFFGEYKENEFNNSKNEAVLPDEIGFTETLYDYFEDLGFDVKYWFRSLEDRYEEYLNWRYENCLGGFEINGEHFSILPEYEENYDIRNIEDCSFCVYSDEEDCYEINGSPYENKEFYEESDILSGDTYAIIINEVNYHLFYEKDGEIYGDDGPVEGFVHNENGDIKYFWFDGFIRVEVGGESFDTRFNNHTPSKIVIPDQKKGDDSFYFNAVDDNGIAYLFKMGGGNHTQILKYSTKNGIFVLKNNEYVCVKDNEDYNSEDTTEFEAFDYRFLPNSLTAYTSGGNGRFVLCTDDFCDDSYRVNIYDTKEKKLLFDRNFLDAEKFDDFFILRRYNNDENAVVDSNTGKILFNKRGNISRSPGWHVIAIGCKDGGVFIKTSPKLLIFTCSEIMYNCAPYFMVKNEEGEIGVIDMITFNFDTSIRDVMRVGSDVACFIDKENVCTIRDGSDRHVVLGKIDFSTLMRCNTGDSYVLIFKKEGDKKYSMFGVKNLRMLFNNSFDGLLTKVNSSLVLRFGDKCRVYDFFLEKFLYNGFLFDFDYDSHTIYTQKTDGDTTVRIFFSKEVTNSVAIYSLASDGSFLHQIPYYAYQKAQYDDELKYYCTEKEYNIIQKIKADVEKGSKINEAIKNKFFDLLNRIEETKL